MMDSIDELLHKIDMQSIKVGNNELYLFALAEMNEKYRGKNLKDPCIKLLWACDIINKYYMDAIQPDNVKKYAMNR